MILFSNDLLRGMEYSPGTAWFAHVRSQENISVFEASTGSGVGQEDKRDKVADGATRVPHPHPPYTPSPVGLCGLTWAIQRQGESGQFAIKKSILYLRTACASF